MTKDKEKKITSTYSNIKPKDISLSDIKKAIDLIKPIPKQHFEMCKKHWEMLKKELRNKDNSPEFMYGNLGAFGGIDVIIKPYLKKVRLYTELTKL